MSASEDPVESAVARLRKSDRFAEAVFLEKVVWEIIVRAMVADNGLVYAKEIEAIKALYLY